MSTRRGMLLALAGLLLAAPAFAQETQFGADVRRERAAIGDSCDSFSPKAIGMCVYTLATASPFHLSFGNLAPLNGFALGLAFNEHYTPNESWRLSWSADAVAAPSGSWRAGAYMKMIHTPATSGVVVRRPGSAPASGTIAPREFTVVDLVAQTISLDTLNFFGVDGDSRESGRTTFGEHQTILGTAVAYPLDIAAMRPLRAALLGGVTGRFVDIRGGSTGGVPSIETVYDNASAPGLEEQRAFLELREGVRLKPSIAGGHVQLNYVFSAEQFVTRASAHSSFHRWTIDLQHEIPIYRTAASAGPRDFNGPDACAQSAVSSECPPVQWSRNREGTVTLRLFFSAAGASAGSEVPFYLQPTLGGADINGQPALASYQDYRFRGPDLFLLQEGVEHSVWGPFGAFLLVEEGAVAERAADIGVTHLRSSATVGLTVRAGGFPMIKLSFAWGSEGHHIAGAVDSTLLGGSTRPSLF